MSAASATGGTTGTGSAPPLTRDVPRFVSKHCASARKKSLLRLVCPPLVPVTRYRTYPGVSGVLAGNEPPAKMYLLGFNGGDTGPTFWHWIAGMGTPAGINRWVLSDAQNVMRGKPKLIRVVIVDGRKVNVWRFPPYPAGGQFGGHDAAITRSGPLLAIASIHGDSAEASVRMAVALARRADVSR